MATSTSTSRSRTEAVPRKFSYWFCAEQTDSLSYSIVGRTYMEVVDQVIEVYGQDAETKADAISRIQHMEVEYTDLFDFFCQLTGEGGGRGTGLILRNPYVNVKS